MAQRHKYSEYSVSLAKDSKLQLELPSGDTLPVERTKKPAKKDQHTMHDSVMLLPIDETIKNMTHGTFEYSQSSKQEASPSQLKSFYDRQSDRIVESLNKRRGDIEELQKKVQDDIKKGELSKAYEHAKTQRRKQDINRFAASVAAPVFAFDMATKIPRPIDPRKLEEEQKYHTLTLSEAVIPETKDLAVEMPNTILTTVGNKQEPSPALPVVESSTRNEAEAQQNQTPTSEQEQHSEDAAIARVQAEIVALTDEKVQEINAAESATDAVFAKGMADIAVQSRIAHEVILPYSAEGIAQLEAVRSDALATLQQALDARNQGAKPATPSQELTPSGAQAELAPAPVSTSEQTPQPTGFEAQVSELTDRTAQEIMASHSTMDAIRMKGEAASVVLSMAAHELMQPHLSHEGAAQLKDTRDRALAALQAALDVRLESPDSHQATSVATEGQPLAEAAQAPEATTAEPAHEEADGSVEENRAADMKAATEVEGKKEGWWARMQRVARGMGQKAMRAVEDVNTWLNEPVPDWKPKPNRSPKNYPLAEIFSQNEAGGQPHEKPQPEVTQPQEAQPAPISESDNSKVVDLNAAAGIIEKKPNPEEDFFDLALALGNKDHSDVIITTPEKPEDPTAFGDFSRDFHDRMAELGARIAQSSTDAELNDNKSKANAEIWSFAKEAERFPGKRFDVIRIIKMADENMQRAVNYNINNRKSGGQAA